MRDLAFALFLMAFIAIGLRRPFLLVLAYCYVDIVAPQRLSYFLVNSIPVSLVTFAFAVGMWVLADDKKDTRFSFRQGLLVLLLIYCALTTQSADFPVEAADKWSWVWKALLWAIFLPLTLRTKLRIEALALTMILCASSIIITGGIKTLAGGGGYGSMQLLVSDNSGLYEGSIISCVAIAIIPIILYLAKSGTVFPPDWRVKLFAYALCFACLLIPIGTQARTGLVCIAALAILMLRFTNHRFAYVAMASGALLVAIPFLPSQFTDRMSTMKEYKSDESASTRVAVWKWTWDYAKEHPFGGGFDAYRGNVIKYERAANEEQGADFKEVNDKSRAYHSSYFEMLGEQGYPGLFLWLLLHAIGIVQMERLHRRYKHTGRDDMKWVSPFAVALQNAQIIYLVGSLFVGIAFQPFIYMLLALQIGFSTYMGRREHEESWRSIADRVVKRPKTV